MFACFTLTVGEWCFGVYATVMQEREAAPQAADLSPYGTILSVMISCGDKFLLPKTAVHVTGTGFLGTDLVYHNRGLHAHA
eukprot:5644430-Amphidinium_carterae.1